MLARLLYEMYMFPNIPLVAFLAQSHAALVRLLVFSAHTATTVKALPSGSAGGFKMIVIALSVFVFVMAFATDDSLALD